MSGAGIGGTLGTVLGVALAPETGGLSLAIPAVAGAAGSALGGEFTGSKNVWRDALLGGIGGAAGGGLNNLSGNASGLGNLFGTGGDIQGALPSYLGGSPAALTSGVAAPIYGPVQSALSPGTESFLSGLGGNEAISPALAAADPTLTSGVSAAPSASSGILGGLGGIGKFAPYAALSGGALLADRMGQPKQVGPASQVHPSNPGSVAPLSRQMQTVDPNSYYAPSTVANRSYYSPYSLQPQFMAKGGAVRRFANGGSASASSSNIPQKRMSSSYGGKLANTAIAHPAMYPIKGMGKSNLRYYADGGPINGPGDGQSDSIPAQLSDGEFVMSAPVVSALGNGSNDAGAKKLDMAQKNILKKHYKGGKPHKAMGLAGYVS